MYAIRLKNILGLIFPFKIKILNFGNIDFLVIFLNYYKNSRTGMQKIKFEIMNTDNRRE